MEIPWLKKEPEETSQNQSPEKENSHPQGSGAGEFDPLREKLVREEAGGAGGPTLEGEPEGGAEDAARNARKADFFTRVLLGGISLALNEVAKVRGDHWRLSTEEKQTVGDALFPVTLKYVEKVWLPVWMDRYQEEMGFAWALIVVLYAKIEIDGKIVEPEKGEGAAVNGKEI